ncbi:hypothetical protein [Chitinophaga solisilvae]|uniref:Uncharacterized protein n=1 Tax=Chitinophaga solisilvae TaxID=1233460 RepID=A0A9Q5DAI3_9BACT|nr:hypothetical protein [Chitinophaga solisilvae]NSL88361.1 hypothetical protein [Chitinophaga solisilvae]
MNHEPYDPAKAEEEDKEPILKRLRESIFPIQPTDSLPVRMLKNSGFYLFAIMFGLVSLALVSAIMFVL